MSAVADYRLIGKSTVCGEITEDDARILASIMGVRELKDGELLVREGEADQSLYILASGRLGVISAMLDGRESLVHTMTEGECAGTRAFVDRTPRKATLRAIGNATVYSMTPDAFDKVVEEHPRLAYKVMRALFRVTHTNLMRMNQESQQLSNYINKTQGRY
jgi:CRP/FNR family transcriptional regulator, cyclic AMP receptor protein